MGFTVEGLNSAESHNVQENEVFYVPAIKLEREVSMQQGLLC